MHIVRGFLKRSKAYCANDLSIFMRLHGSGSRSVSHPEWQSRTLDIKDSVILNNWLEKVSIAIIESLIQFINFNLLMFHLARLYCCWNSRTVVFYFHAVTSVGQESLILYKGFADNHLAKECTLRMIFLFDSFMCHKASFQCVITIPGMLQSLCSSAHSWR